MGNAILNEYSGALMRPGGNEELVTFRLPSLREMERYLDVCSKPSELVEWLCGDKKAGWADQFADDSVIALAERIGRELDPRLAVWAQYQAATIQRLGPYHGALRKSLRGPSSPPAGGSGS
jgi:hypothetical protein